MVLDSILNSHVAIEEAGWGRHGLSSLRLKMVGL